MKRKMISLISFLALLVLSICYMTSCGSDQVKATVLDHYENLLAIKIDETDGKATLQDAMENLREADKIAYQTDATGMITAIGGVENGVNSYWMLYTTDSEFSNAEWGTCAYAGKDLQSAILGAASLVVKTGEIYVWSYQTFG
ncbi:MAG: DUF4430 domain-containing protein [Clostridia bacterium]|nr:DUF4430 domain-containing protein [Clostridia bacterium]